MSRRLMLWGLLAAGLGGCTESGQINIFTVDDDIQLGQQVRDEIAADPATYPLLDEADYPDAYDHIYAVRDEILASGKVDYADRFDWEIHLIDDDDTLNAFCTPGGYIYIYTGIIRFLEVEDAFAGVLGHEMAHAARRHTTEQLTKIYGIDVLLSVIFGEDPGLLPQIAATLVSLSFSRADEAEADEYSVRYLCETDYAADGAALFFEELDSSNIVPEFLSDHPSDQSRIEDITSLAEQLGCSTELNPDADYQSLIDALP